MNKHSATQYSHKFKHTNMPIKYITLYFGEIYGYFVFFWTTMCVSPHNKSQHWLRLQVPAFPVLLFCFIGNICQYLASELRIKIHGVLCFCSALTAADGLESACGGTYSRKRNIKLNLWMSYELEPLLEYVCQYKS